MDAVKDYIKEIKGKFSQEEIKAVLDSFADKKVLVIGDAIIDEYCFVEPKGRAMKDPMLSVNHVKEEAYVGGIMAIANHTSNFVKEVTMVTVLGDGLDRKDFIEKGLNKNISGKYFTKVGAPTTRKRRYISSVRNEKLFKIEYMRDTAINEELEKEIVIYLENELPLYDLVIVGDFGHGFINKKIVQVLEEKSKYLAVNVQTNSANIGFNYVTKYNKPNFISMDGAELRFSVGDKESDYKKLVDKLNQMKNFDNFLVTIGKEGALYYKNGIFESPAFISKITDAVGAGDAVFSVASLFALVNAKNEMVPFVANCVGGVAVSIMGNKKSVSKEDLINFIDNVFRHTKEIEINQYLSSVNNALSNLNKKEISDFVKMLMEAYHQDKNIYIFGNGGSAATASHFAGDLVKGVSCGLDKRFKVICLNDNIPAMMAIANDISYDDIFIEQLKNFLRKDDIVIGISGSGNSINVVKALEYANSAGAKTVAVCGYKGGKIKDIAQIAIHSEIDDMEISEDIHNLVITHCIKRVLTNELGNTNVGKVYEDRILT